MSATGFIEVCVLATMVILGSTGIIFFAEDIKGAISIFFRGLALIAVLFLIGIAFSFFLTYTFM